MNNVLELKGKRFIQASKTGSGGGASMNSKKIVTREQLPKQELLRIVRDKEGKVSVDQTGKLGGRGAYIKKDINVIEKAKKTKILERHLEVSVPDSVYEELENYVK